MTLPRLSRASRASTNAGRHTPWDRRGILLACIVACAGGWGCAHFPVWRQGDPYAATARCVLQPGATPDELVRHVNRNASSLTGWRATSARISSRGEKLALPMSVGAMFAVEAPRSFRIVAYGPTGGAEVDFGSNEEQCWFWAKRDESRRIMTCKHDRLEHAHRRMPFPIEPEWIAEVLGVMPIDSEGLDYEPLPVSSDGRQRARFTRTTTSPNGATFRRVMIVDACHGIVLEHAVHDATDRLLARAVLSGHARAKLPTDGRYSSTGPIMPARIDFEWPQHEMAITVQLGVVEVNPSQPAAQFNVPDYKGYVSTDLGT